MIVWPVSRSSWPVGSSASRSRGSVGEGAGDRDPLLLAARQLVGAVPGTLAQADELEQVLDPPIASARLGVHEPERDLDVLGGGQDRARGRTPGR